MQSDLQQIPGIGARMAQSLLVPCNTEKFTIRYKYFFA